MHNLFTSMYNSTLLIYISTFGWVQSDKSPHVRNVASLRQIWFMRVSGIPSKRHCCNAFPWLPCMVFGMFKTYRYCWYLVCLKHTDIVSEKFKNHFLLKTLLLSLTSSRRCNRDNLGQIYGLGCQVNAHDFNKTAPCLPHLPIPGHHRVISGAKSANSSTHSLYKDSLSQKKRYFICLLENVFI